MNLVTIGTFDGVHRGHQRLLKALIRRAKERGLGSRVLVFAQPPRLLFRPELSLRLVTTPQERAEIMRSLGVGGVEVLRFSRRIAALSPKTFFERILLRRLKAGGALVGADFFFGRGRSGDVRTLEALCRSRGLYFEAQPLLKGAGAKVSSSRVRELLEAGKVEQAARLMGRPYALIGKVVAGRGLGRTIGFPTANLKIPPGKILPLGVFAARASWDGRTCGAAVNIGVRPTVDGTRVVLVEAHLLDWKGRLVGRSLKLELLKRLRAEKKFPSLDALKAQIARDVRAAKAATGKD